VKENPNFRFTAKLWRGFTHERNATAEDEKLVKDGTAPLVETERLGAILMQFPISFQNTPDNASTWPNFSGSSASMLSSAKSGIKLGGGNDSRFPFRAGHRLLQHRPAAPWKSVKAVCRTDLPHRLRPTPWPEYQNWFAENNRPYGVLAYQRVL
jgi:hypothetical protein